MQRASSSASPAYPPTHFLLHRARSTQTHHNTKPQEEAAAELLLLEGEDEEARDAFTGEEVFELIRNLNDPEHPLTLEQLKVATVR